MLLFLVVGSRKCALPCCYVLPVCCPAAAVLLLLIAVLFGAAAAAGHFHAWSFLCQLFFAFCSCPDLLGLLVFLGLFSPL